MRVGLFGGSFDPVHNGHIKLATEATRQLRLTKTNWILSKQSPHKTHQKITRASHRLVMLKTALKGMKRHRIIDWELKRRGPSFAITTLKQYCQRYPKQKIFYVMGSDVLKSFSKWKNPREILDLVTIVVGLRPGAPRMQIAKNLRKKVVFLKGKFPEISSRQIRARVGQKHKLKKTLPASVVGYIYQKKLYR